ncbi:MAG: hypothetical protein R2752_20565 [Vicinamibacterales bacterium]
MSRRQALTAGAGGVVIVAVVAGLGRHPASVGASLAFHAAFVLLIALAVPRPRSHFYSALTAMLVLGFWTKFLVRLLADYEYLEPVGSFDGSPAAWDRALVTVAAGILGVVTCRLVHLGWARSRPWAAGRLPEATRPRAFDAWRPWIWTATGVAAAALYGWNAYAAVYITGVTPRVVLPFPLNAAIAWWYVLGLPLWLATLIGWELAARSTGIIGARFLVLVMAEAVVNAASLLSRASFVLRLAPYLLAGTRRQTRRPVRLGLPPVVVLLLLAAGFGASLVPVTLLRVQIYSAVNRPPPDVPTNAAAPVPGPRPAAPPGLTPPGQSQGQPAAGGGPSAAPSPAAPAPSPLTATRLRFAAIEVGRLVFDRWTGMEGVLAVTAVPDRSAALFGSALRENPALGERALYQRVARAPYPVRPDFTFLTLAGAIAVLAFSGSSLVVWLGMAVLAAVCLACESFCRRYTGNEIVCAVLGVGAAFAVAQATFPRLLGVFLIELWVTVGCLAWLHARLAPAVTERP